MKTIFQALIGGAKWEDSLADAWGEGTRERRKAMRRAEKYRNLRKRLGGPPTVEDALDAKEQVSLSDLLERTDDQEDTTAGA